MERFFSHQKLALGLAANRSRAHLRHLEMNLRLIRIHSRFSLPSEMQHLGAALLLLALATLVHTGSAQRQCPSANLFYAHERNCDMYYQCENGTLREGICPDGLVFDDRQSPDVLKCEMPFQIDCSYRAALQPPQSTEHCPRLYGLYAHESDCTRFWQCVEGHAFAFYCPEGLAYNEYSAHCDWPDEVETCDSESLLSFRCPQPTDQELQDFGDPRYPYPGDCRKHYVCILTPDGSRKPRLLACDPGLVFNPRTSSCDDPENVQGCQGYYNNLDARRLRELFGRR